MTVSALEVRLVGAKGEQMGIVSITEALRLAQEADLDLVELAPTARPPVCKLMDYGKFKYEVALKARESPWAWSPQLRATAGFRRPAVPNGQIR